MPIVDSIHEDLLCAERDGSFGVPTKGLWHPIMIRVQESPWEKHKMYDPSELSWVSWMVLELESGTASSLER